MNNYMYSSNSNTYHSSESSPDSWSIQRISPWDLSCSHKIFHNQGTMHERKLFKVSRYYLRPWKRGVDLKKSSKKGSKKATLLKKPYLFIKQLFSVPDPRSCIGSRNALCPVHDFWLIAFIDDVVAQSISWPAMAVLVLGLIWKKVPQEFLYLHKMKDTQNCKLLGWV